MTEIKPIMSPWFPETDTNTVRGLGKTLEELGECTSAVARCLIQGINEVEPTTKKSNRQWLQDEVADVMAQFAVLIDSVGLDNDAIQERAERKVIQMREWRAML